MAALNRAESGERREDATALRRKSREAVGKALELRHTGQTRTERHAHVARTRPRAERAL